MGIVNFGSSRMEFIFCYEMTYDFRNILFVQEFSPNNLQLSVTHIANIYRPLYPGIGPRDGGPSSL